MGICRGALPAGGGGAPRNVRHHRTPLREAVGAVHRAGGRAGAPPRGEPIRSIRSIRFFDFCKATRHLPENPGKIRHLSGEAKKWNPGFSGKPSKSFLHFSHLLGLQQKGTKGQRPKGPKGPVRTCCEWAFSSGTLGTRSSTQTLDF